MRTITKGFLLSTLFLFSALHASKLCSRTQVIMGTYARINIPCSQSAKIELGFETLKEVESSLSSYDKKALLYKLNHQNSVQLDTHLSNALILSQEVYIQSDGYFDISIGSITKGLYHFGEDETVPSKKSLTKANINFSALKIGQQRATLQKGVTLDLGGMGKGFGVDRAYEALWGAGVREGSVALSGDIRVFSPMQIEIQDPFSDKLLYTLVLKEGNTGVSTSGNYRRYVHDKDHNHLINPKTKTSQKTFASITLVSHLSSAYLDAYATCASVMPYDKAIKFLEGLDLEYLLILNNKQMVKSKNLE